MQEQYGKEVRSFQFEVVNAADTVSKLYDATMTHARDAGLNVSEYSATDPATKARYFYIEVSDGIEVKEFRMAYRPHPISLGGKHGKIFKSFCKEVLGMAASKQK